VPAKKKTETDVDSVIRDPKKSIEVLLPDKGEKVRLAKLKYSQMKEVSREEDNWKRNDISILRSLENAGNPKTQEWLDDLTTTDVMELSNAFAVLTAGNISLEDWLSQKHPNILNEYRAETEGRPGSNPLRGSSMRGMDSLSFG